MSRWKWASLSDSPWLPCGFDRPNRRSFRKSLCLGQLTVDHCSDTYVLFLIPECKGNILQAVRVAHTSNAVLSPAEGARACHIVSEVCRVISETQWRISRTHTAPCISVMTAKYVSRAQRQLMESYLRVVLAHWSVLVRSHEAPR